MGSEVEPEPSFTPKLPLFSIQTMQSPDPSGMLTPPLHTLASVPFRWEDEPGKPRPCTTLTKFTTLDLAPKCLELPPRLLLDTKLPSPNTVLEGPYLGRSKFQSSSFRIIGGECYGSFSHERGQLGAMVLSKRGIKEKTWFGSWGRRIFKGKREVGLGGGSHVFPSSVDKEGDSCNVGESNSKNGKITRIRKVRSLSSLSTNAKSHHFWVSFSLKSFCFFFLFSLIQFYIGVYEIFD